MTKDVFAGRRTVAGVRQHREGADGRDAPVRGPYAHANGSVRRLAFRGAIVAFVSLASHFLAAGCTTVRVTATERSSIEQRLIVRSLERAAARLDITPLVGRSVRLELFTLTKDERFAREFLRTRLEGRGLHIVSASPADLTLQVFTSALAVDTSDTLLGLPAMQAPVLAIPIPEIAVFKWERSRGHAELQSYVYDMAGRLLGHVHDVLGQAKWDRFKILIFISFTITDIDKRPPEP